MKYHVDEIFDTYETEHISDFYAILAREFFPFMRDWEFWDVRNEIWGAGRDGSVSEELADEVANAFTGAFCAYQRKKERRWNK